MNPHRIIFIALCALLLAAPLALAHEIGAMLVRVRVDAQHIARVTIDADVTESPSTAVVKDPQRESLERVQSGCSLLADGESLALTPDTDPPTANTSPSKPSKLRLHLRAIVPTDTKSLAWTTRLPIGQHLIRFEKPGDADTTNAWIEPGQTTPAFVLREDAAPTRGSPDTAAPAAERTPPRSASHTTGNVFVEYIALGFTHILPHGADHILFVLGLFLLSPKLKPVLTQVTAFTIAHSITLALSVLDIIHVPSSFVEPAIAISIVLVGVENIISKRVTPWRTALVFAFGLLHGMGFAGVLQEVGLPRNQLAPALVGFNVGVEIGQLAVITLAWAAVGVWTSQKSWYRPRVCIPASLLIAGMGAYWAFERLAG